METLEKLIQGKWFYDLAVFLVRNAVRVVYGLRVHGASNVPPPGTAGAVIASNHFSSFDPPVLGVCVPREVHFMAKKELFENRWSRLLMLGLRAFPVDRSRSDMGAIKDALRRLGSGVAVGIFAQGTRNRGDAEALDGAAYLAQRAGVPLVPAAIWREGRAFHVSFGEPIWPQGKGREAASALTAELMRRVGALLPEGRGPGPGRQPARRA